MLKKAIVLFVITLFISSCEKKYMYSESQITQGFWHKDSIIEFNFTSKDTLKRYNCFINIWNTEDYKYNNLFLITTMQFPYGRVVVDTLEYKMAFKDGKLMGEGIGSLKYNKLWYKENVIFSEHGEYNIQIRQAMREAGQIESLVKLDGIEEIGFSYEPVNSDE